MKKLFFFISLISFVGCGGGHNPDKEKLNSAIPLGSSSYYDLGLGKALMSSVLSSAATGGNFDISFDLQDGGKFQLVTFSNSTLQNGFIITFERTGQILKVMASAQGQEQDWSPRFTTVDASQTLNFNLDIHNDEKPAHVLIWQGSKNSALDHTNTLYNSAEDSVDLDYEASPGNGLGRQWGFILQQGQIHQAVLSSPQDGH